MAVAELLEESHTKNISRLADEGVATCGDLVNGDRRELSWIDPKVVGAAWLVTHLPHTPPDHALSLRVGQFWRLALSSPISSGEVVEILGLLGPSVRVRVWKLTGSLSLCSGAKLVLMGQHTLETTDMIFGDLRKCLRIYVSIPKMVDGGCYRAITHAVRQYIPRLNPLYQSDGWTSHAASLLRDMGLVHFDMFSDGS
jgi:hypothetical protein